MRFLLLWAVVVFTAKDVCEAHWDAAYFHSPDDGFSLKQNWMSRIRDDVKLFELAIPGTHDSSTYKYNVLVDNVRTQTSTFEQQLNFGIRVFDIRVRHWEDTLYLYHGIVYLYLTLDDFLSAVENFLTDFPTETVMFRLKNEHTPEGNTRSMKETLLTYLKRYPKFLQTNYVETRLEQARGRYIIISDDNEFHELGIPYYRLDVQDNYNLNTNWDLYSKWEAVKAHLLKASEGDDTIYMNYLSGSGGSFPYFVASGHSSPQTGAPRLATGQTTPGWWWSYPDFPRLDCFIGICSIYFEGTNTLTRDILLSIGGRRTVGIIMADFPGESLISQIIENNRILGRKAPASNYIKSYPYA